jgi:hypothetical protein
MSQRPMKQKRRSLHRLLFVILGFMLCIGAFFSIGFSQFEYGDSSVTLWINTPQPQDYKVRVLRADWGFEVLDQNGMVTLIIPGARIKTVSILGFKYPGDQHFTEPIVEVISGEAVVKRLSMDDLNRGPHKRDGSLIVEL